MRVFAPVSGKVVAMEDVPDPVFAQAIVGPGLAIEPDADATKALAPVSGRIAKIHPHAVVIEAEAKGVLAHLGLNTVELNGQGFTLHAADNEDVQAGQIIIEWDPQAVREGGRSAIVPVVAMQAKAEDVHGLVAPGEHVNAGQALLEWD
ncbi:MAG: PTS glucose transporter subunit IIA [Propionibacteriaceae bacterium]|jgi:glucose-specific phosphotransferase system IIA component|nr:PTS glucose transporter subunit IIA [Propionibacteriaceae bacterium]